MSRSQQVALHGKDNRLGGIDPSPPGRWQQPGTASPFLNGWVNAGGGLQTFRWRRTNENQTEIQGFVTDGTAQPVINLPDPYRPAEIQYAVNADSDGTLLVWTFEPSGDLSFVEATAGGGASGPAGGDLTGTYPNPTIASGAVGETEIALADVTSDNVTSTAHGFAPKSPADSTKFLDGSATPAWDTVKDSDLSTSDITTNDVTSTKHGFTPKSPADSTKFLDGSATPAWDTVKDSDLSTSDITTNDVTTSKHGFTPKAPNDTAKFLRGDATWAAVGGVTTVIATDVFWDAKGDLAGGTGADAASRLPVGSNGKLLTAASGETTGMKWDSGYLGGLELVYKYTVTGSDKASIDTGADTADAGTNDWTNGDVLEVFIISRTDAAGATQSFDVTLNNDTGANYDSQYVYGVNVTASSGVTAGDTKWLIDTHGSGGSASFPASAAIVIPNYTGTSFYKTASCQEARLDTTAGNKISLLYALAYRSTSAVTRFKMACQSTSKFKVGTQLLIYKRRNA